MITEKIEAQIATLTQQEVISGDFELCVEHGVITVINPMNEFVDSIIDLIDIKAIKNANLKVLIDRCLELQKTHCRQCSSTDAVTLTSSTMVKTQTLVA
ncbi:GlcNAc phosphomutase [Vibrio maritimus]|uniref:GlcNAc phosphomutase n=1 Tax=Vibrio maritimus TaxID=990268 RepID=A0A090RVJ0_9VIBR|nr:GlcNAc phosphomutase [Vibrio maritimus]